jgi:hypothetical protein
MCICGKARGSATQPAGKEHGRQSLDLLKLVTLFQELIEQFNRDEDCQRRLQRRKLMLRVRFPKLAALSDAILDLRDELSERSRPADCISSKWMGDPY